MNKYGSRTDSPWMCGNMARLYRKNIKFYFVIKRVRTYLSGTGGIFIPTEATHTIRNVFIGRRKGFKSAYGLGFI